MTRNVQMIKLGVLSALPCFPNPVQPSPTESQSSEILVNGSKKLLRSLEAKRNVADVEVLHVVTAFHVFVDNTEMESN